MNPHKTRLLRKPVLEVPTLVDNKPPRFVEDFALSLVVAVIVIGLFASGLFIGGILATLVG